MSRRRFGTPLERIVAGLFIVIAVAILMDRPSPIPWNSGARDQLKGALRAIAIGLVQGRLSTADFSFWGVPHQDGRREFAERHGITVPWHDGPSSEDVLFVPLALGSAVAIDPDAAARVPQIVMVPVDSADVPTLPVLHPWANVPENGLRECQLRAMKAAFTRRKIRDAATLMSDGRVLHMQVDDLFR